MKSLTQYYLALMSIAILGTYSGSTGATATSILTSVLGLPSTESTNTSYSSFIAFDTSIQLGSGTQSFSPTLNSLNAPISNGSGTGQLIYNSQSVSYTTNSISQLLIASNTSGNTITVSEIGLMSKITVWGFGGTTITKNYLLSYDTFSTPISIPNGGSTTFEIIINFSG
jgi:hypothetical protein